MQLFSSVRWFIVLTIFAMLSACGGGSSSSSDGDDSTADTAQGIFIDSPVQGLMYVSGNISGTTDENGQFTYYVNEEVYFYIGSLPLGATIGTEIVTPITLIEGATDATNPAVINMIRLLQTLDSDGDAENGIVITTAMTEIIDSLSLDIDFSLTVAEFEVDSDVLALLEAIPGVSGGTGRTLIDAETAIEHFTVTIEGEGDYDTSDFIEITESEFNDLFDEDQQGVIRWIMQTDGTTTISSEGLSATMSGSSKYVYASVWEQVSGDWYADSCTLDGLMLVETSDETSLEESFEDYCSDLEITYYKSSDGETGKAVMECAGEDFGTVEMTLLSESPEFDLGSASVSFDSYPAVTTTDGICGTFTNTDQEMTSSLTGTIDINSHEITFRVPYQDNYLLFTISFSAEPEAGEYTVVEDMDEDVSDEVEIKISSGSDTEFSATADSPFDFDSVSGTLTLTAVTTTTASGSFDIVTRDDNNINESISGEFNLAVE